MSVFHLPRLHFTGTATTWRPVGPGNGHFAIDAAVSGVERRPGEADATDPAVGRRVDMWGHYNEYLQTTANRARVFDLDPSSDRTTTLMVGQFGLGRGDRSHDTDYLLTGAVHGFSPPRWHDARRGTVVHQFVVAREDVTWLVAGSVAAEMLSDGIVVQFALLTPATPQVPDAPRRWDLRGTVAPWHRGESRTYPAGRLLVPVDEESYPLTVEVADGHVMFNLPPPRDAELRTAGEALLLASTRDGRILSREREINLHVDDACVFLEHPRHPGDHEHDVEVGFRAFVRGRPAPVANVALRHDPAGIVHGVVTCPGADGAGRIVLRGIRAGTTRVVLTVDGHEAGDLFVRVLPDDWWLADLPPEEITFELVHREVLAPYERRSSFMRQEVFSLADRCKVDTYAKLIWQMCDPRNKGKTYYMPPTRDLTLPKAGLLLRYLRSRQRPEHVLRTVPAAPVHRGLRTREELVSALRDGVTLELAVMLQYLYAAYSVPAHGAGLEYVRTGDWTAEQLRTACGDGGETLDGGIRGVLVRIAREEMIHFLAVNNILTAIGEPFHVPDVDFGTVNANLPVPLDLCLERLNPASVERFAEIERPAGRTDVLLGDRAGRADLDEHTYSSISELYRDIRQGLRDIPDLFLTERGRTGGEHHLFLRAALNDRHPDYQVRVDDLTSALFAIDVVTEQGEGGELADGDEPAEESHYEAFRGLAAVLRHGWVPSYPTVRNPTVRRGDRTRQYVPDPDAREVMRLFNESYSVMLRLMVQHFGGGPDTSLRRSRLMNTAIDVMTGVMRPLGELLVTMPSGLPGRTAGPSFELDDPPAFVARQDVAVRRIAQRLAAMAVQAVKCPLVPAGVAELCTVLADQIRGG
ncbi:ferritin-like domain-containing protein [Actinophytocola sp.]|uniref:ferritin-like domain-containing protein n=1 Tax=Actinophytocola sp. TaxID=1872138 RepID=UPI002D584D5D|nr:ferritin-like domain-containing protein [Actinophytocola sp.]HYQ68141.1 ferritin-like domain-containing protein [Actinophytocola sp.]